MNLVLPTRNGILGNVLVNARIQKLASQAKYLTKKSVSVFVEHNIVQPAKF